MSSRYYRIGSATDSVSMGEFFERLQSSGLLKDFDFWQIMLPVYTFRNEFLNHIAEHGLSSLYNFSIVMEDVTSPSMNVNDIEEVVKKFVSSLTSATRLLLIDPYFYSKSVKIDVPKIFGRLISGISTTLEEIVIVTNGRKNETKSDIHSAINSLNSQTKISDFTTDEFHDRYWIDPNRNIGVVMGTSLNGLGNRIALVDRLQPDDVVEIVKLAKSLGTPV